MGSSGSGPSAAGVIGSVDLVTQAELTAALGTSVALVSGLDTTGVADASATINATIAALSTAGGGKALLPAGILGLSGRIILKSNVTLAGQGRGSTKLRPLTGYSDTALVSADAADTVVRANVEDLQADMSTVTPGSTCHGIRLDTASRCQVRGVRVNQSRDVGIRFVTTTESLITDCDIEFSGSGGVTTHGVELATNSDRCIVTNNFIYKPGGMCVYVNGSAGCEVSNNTLHGVEASSGGLECVGVNATSPKTKVIGNACYYGGDNGISASADLMTVIGNTVDSPVFNGIYVKGVGTTVMGNTIRNACRLGDTVSGGIKLDSCSRCRIIGNIVRDDQTPKTTAYALRAISSTASCVIAFNDFSDYLTAALGGDWNIALNTVITNAGVTDFGGYASADVFDFIASRMVVITGSPNVLVTNRTPAYMMDAAAAEIIGNIADLPGTWTTYAVDLYWINGGAGAGDVVWRFDGIFKTDGDTTANPTTGSLVTATAGAQNVIVKTTIATGLSATAAKMLVFNVARVATDAADTLANDAGIVKIRLRRLT